jgi:hypothetical protein
MGIPAGSGEVPVRRDNKMMMMTVMIIRIIIINVNITIIA